MTSKEFEATVVFSLAELARLSSVHPRRLRKLLVATGVRLLRSGTRILVARVDLLETLPHVYQGILERLRLAEADDAASASQAEAPDDDQWCA